MTVWGVSMVRDEADVIEGTLRHLAAEGLDGLLVADNGSVDGTRDILLHLANELPLVVVDDNELAYHQSEKMTRLAQTAAGFGADWIVPFDADELWVAHADRLAVVLEEADGNVAVADLYNHFPSAIDPAGSDPFRTIVWRQADPAGLPKIAFRWEPGAVIHQGNHGVTLESQVLAAQLEVRHFPYRSAQQFVRKARNGAQAYAATSLPPDQGAHWRAYGELLERYGPDTLETVFRDHFWHLSPVDAGLIHDPAPYIRW